MMQHWKTDKGAVLVTGASSGIGSACALKLDQAGYRVFAGVRLESDAQRLRQQASPLLTPVLLDVTDKALIAAAVSQVEEAVNDAGLVGLVNNAGIAVPAPLEVIPLAELRRQFEVNVIGQVAVTQAMLPLLRTARGRIINIGSVASRMTFPFAGALSASKSALEALNAALRMELSPWGIHVILITPATVRTPGGDKLQHDSEEILRTIPEEDAKRYATPLRAYVEAFSKQEATGSPPEVVADAILRALVEKTPRTEYPVGRGSRLLPLLARLLPTRVLDGLRLQVLGLAHQPEMP
jgi:NAD(P)-dependent dehydrogenase (short-subunit alcohol dehydrogenase family)